MLLQSPLARTLLLAALSSHAVALVLPFTPVPVGALEAEGLGSDQPIALTAARPNGTVVDRSLWTITADSEQTTPTAFPITNTIDGDNTTYWHTQYKPTADPLPHTVTINMSTVLNVNGMTYVPRQDGSPNGNIGQHKIYISTDAVTWQLVAFGTWYDDQTEKSAAFETIPAQYVKIVAVTEAGNRGPWSSASEFNVYTAAYTTPPLGLGAWGPTINIPLVAVEAAIEPDTGNLLTWSSWAYNYQYNAPKGHSGQTLTSTYYPATGIVTQRLVNKTGHDMFCPGISFGATGQILVTGGNSNKKLSIYTAGTDSWVNGTQMNVGRGYHSQATMGDGRIFVIGGSWSGGVGGKNGEIYDPKLKTWTKLPGCTSSNMLTADAGGQFRSDNHGWLFSWSNKHIFQAGPSHKMNWYNASTATGGVVAAGVRGDDTDAMCGNAVMYDAAAGKILATNGSPNYQNTAATANAHLITIGAVDIPVTTQNLSPASYQRIFGSSVVLPDGTVFITGGQTVGVPYSDAGSIFTSELWDPTTLAFTSLIPNSTPRNYHSWALLRPDATVFVGGGGMCLTCSTNHFDAQVYTPQYLLNADGTPKTSRPVIKSISARNQKPGGTLTVTTDSAVTAFSLVRYSAATHTVNTDQRRLPLVPIAGTGANTYKMTVGPADYGVVTPGYWMLFALNSAGTPSLATTIYIV